MFVETRYMRFGGAGRACVVCALCIYSAILLGNYIILIFSVKSFEFDHLISSNIINFYAIF